MSRCYHCNGILGTGDVDGLCYYCREKFKPIDIDGAKITIKKLENENVILKAELEEYKKHIGRIDDDIISDYEMMVREYALENNSKLSIDAKQLKAKMLESMKRINLLSEGEKE